MARIRTIKPSFWGSPTVAALSRDARLLAIGLMSFADDDGRFLAALNAINGYVFPNDDLPPTKVKKWLTECEEVGFVHLYALDGVTYGCIPTWHLHQVISRYTPSRLPEPDVDCAPRNQGKAA
ncbi:MAG: hypothetical protein IPM11_00700 [Micropruina sp.]|nr:hypothetical protein [Micropruina sp.]